VPNGNSVPQKTSYFSSGLPFSLSYSAFTALSRTPLWNVRWKPRPGTRAPGHARAYTV